MLQSLPICIQSPLRGVSHFSTWGIGLHFKALWENFSKHGGLPMKKFLFLVLLVLLSACAAPTQGELALEPAVVLATSTTEPTPAPSATPLPPSYLKEEVAEGEPMLTEWYVCAFIKEGEGIQQALSRVAESQAGDMGWPVGQTIEIFLIEEDKLVLYDWKTLLEESPVVHVGDYVCDTIHPRLQGYRFLGGVEDRRSP
jgi:hypothetical protein